MDAAQLGRLEKVDLRTDWTNEAAAFAPRLKRLDPAEYEEALLEEEAAANSSPRPLT